MRTGLISHLRAVLRQEGLRVPSGSSAAIDARVARVDVPVAVQAVVTPLLEALRALTPLIATQIARSHGSPHRTRSTGLQSVPGVGPIVSLTYRATLDAVERFPSAGHASSSVGLVPREDSSAERRQRGHITKVGPREARGMLIQAAWSCWRSRSVRTTQLRTWADALAARRGKRIAVVGLRVASVGFSMRSGATAPCSGRPAARR